MMKKAIYPGSFDPITNGHIDIIERAKSLFNEVHVGVIHNPDKTSLFSLDERIQLVRTFFKDDPQIKVDGFDGLLVEFAKMKEISTVIRGLRAVSDFDYEFQMSLTNRRLYPEIDTVFFMTDEKYSYLSSSVVRQLAQYRGNISEFVPLIVQNALKEKYRNE